jgi:hypothetical protein
MLAIIWMQGARYPWSDEWNLVPYLANVRRIGARWFWTQHVDHRIPMVKLAYLFLYQVRPGDFRLPIFLDAILMGIAAGVFLLTAKMLRGQASYADVFFPLSMMHMNLGVSWWGFQMQFVLPTFLLCVVIAASSSLFVEGSGGMSVRRAWVITVPMLLLPLCGTNGLVLSLGVILFAILVVRWYYRLSGRKVNAVGIVCAGMGLTVLVDGLYFVGFSRVDHHWGALTFSSFLRTTVGVILAPFGMLASTHLPVALSLLGVLGGWLLVKIIRTYPLWRQSERRYFFSLVALCGSAMAVAVAVGYGRGGRGWIPDLTRHYSVLVLPLYAGAFLLATRMRMSILTMMMALLMTGLYFAYLPASVRIARDVWRTTIATDNALSASADVESFVASQVSSLYFVDNEWARASVREGLLALGRQSVQTDRGVLRKYNKFMDGESTVQLVKFLPSETEGITYNFDEFQDRGGAFFVRGWAYMKGQSAEKSLIYIVLASKGAEYMVQAMPQKRPDVTAYFGSGDYDDSGFVLSLRKGDLETGEYRVGIYIKKGGIEGLQYTNRFIRL